MAALGETRAVARPSVQEALPRIAPTVVAAVAVVGVAYDDGGYALSFRLALAIAVWWGIAIAAILGLGRWRLTRSGVRVLALLSAFTVWTFVSAWWAPNAETAVEEFARNALYAGILLAALVAGGRTTSWIDGFAVGTAGVGFLALASRLFPSLRQ